VQEESGVLLQLEVELGHAELVVDRRGEKLRRFHDGANVGVVLFVPFLILNTKSGELFRLFVQFFFFFFCARKKKNSIWRCEDVQIRGKFNKFGFTLKNNAQKTHILFAQFNVVGTVFSGAHCEILC
jgi:hypothetical protein